MNVAADTSSVLVVAVTLCDLATFLGTARRAHRRAAFTLPPFALCCANDDPFVEFGELAHT